MTANPLKLSLEIEARASEAKRALDVLIAKVRESGRAAAEANRESAGAARMRAAQTRELSRVEKDMATLGVRSNREIRAEIDKVRVALDRIKKSPSTSWSSDMARASEAARIKLEALRREMAGIKDQSKDLNRSTGLLSSAWGKLAAVWATVRGLSAGRAFVDMVENMDRLNARLKLSEGSALGAGRAMEEIKRIAREVAVPVQGVGDAYVRFSTATARLGISQDRTVKFTEALTKSLKISGASAATAGIVMQQLGQAFDSGRLAGDEFKSVAENGGKVLDYLADQLGVTRGQLRKMSEDGELTVEKMLALADAADQIDKDFQGMPRTVGDALTRMGNAIVLTASKSKALRLAFGAVALALEWVTERLSVLVSGAVVVGLSALVAKAGGIALAWAAVARALAAARVALIAFSTGHPVLLAITVATATLVALWEKLPKAVRDLATSDLDLFQGEIADLERATAGMETTLATALDAVNEGIKDTRKSASESAKAVSDAYATIATRIDQSAKDQIGTIERRYREEMRLIDETKGRSDGRYLVEVQALASAVREQLGVLRDAAQQKLKLLDEEARERERVLGVMYDTDRDRAAALANLDQEIASKKRTVLAGMLNDYRAHVDRLNTEARRHLDTIRDIEEQKRRLSMDGEEKIRDLRRRTMDDYSAYQDRIKEIDEWTSKARKSLIEGDSTAALEYAKKAEQAAGRVAGAVEKDGQVLVTQQQAVETAIGKTNEAINIQQQALDARKSAHQRAAEVATTEAQQVSAAMASMTTELEKLNASIISGAEIIITTNVEALRGDVEALETLITEKDRLMTIRTNLDEVQESLGTVKERMAGLKDVPVELRTNLDEVKTKVSELKKSLGKPTTGTHTVKDNAAAVQAAINRLKQHTKSTHTIYVYKVQAGGKESGVEPAPQKRAEGGWVQAFAAGGRAWRRLSGYVSGPGTGTSDSIRALLSNGEFVLRERAASLISTVLPGFMERLNLVQSGADLRGLLAAIAPPVPRCALGGPVSLGRGAAPQETITWLIRAGEIEAPVRIVDQDSRKSLDAVTKELTRMRLLQG